MRIRISRRSTYRYEIPARGGVQQLRLTPRPCDSQRIASWRIEVDRDCRLFSSEDAFGNILHRFSVAGPFDSLTILVEGEVETFDTAGVLRGAIERFPPSFYMRETALTRPNAALRAFAQEAARASNDALSRLHALLAATFEAMTCEETIRPGTEAAEAFARRSGSCEDAAHVLIAGVRALELPARYVSGFLWRADRPEKQALDHAWVEAHVEGLGWVGFDPSRCLSPNDAYVRVAIGLDALGAAPIRGAHMGGAGEILEVNLRVQNAQSQTQS